MSVCEKIGVSITNQEFVCLLWGDGEAEVRVAPTIEQSDIVHAISLPNANSIQVLHFYTQRCRLQAKVFAEIRIFIKKFVYFLKKS